jgi:acetate kinase
LRRPNVQENQLITPELIDEMERYTAFAPLHTPIAVYIMREALRLFPGVPNFVCLDTYFHRTMPEVVTHMPIPEEYSAMGVRRYGYHGISYESIVYQLQPNVPEKLIVAHLGNGASISAIRNGKCLDTSMGLTPTGGIISGTRTGDIDPGVLLFILRKIARRPSAAEAADQLETVASKKAGLLGVSELSNDMRDLRDAIKPATPRRGWPWTNSPGPSPSGSAAMWPSWAGWTCWSSPAASAKTTSPRAPKSAPAWARWASCSTRRNNVRGEAVISAENSPVTVRVIPPAEDLIIVNHVVRLLVRWDWRWPRTSPQPVAGWCAGAGCILRLHSYGQHLCSSGCSFARSARGSFWDNRGLSAVVLLLLASVYTLGLLDVILLAPLWIQVAHLLAADVLWVALVVLTARLTLQPREAD